MFAGRGRGRGTGLRKQGSGELDAVLAQSKLTAELDDVKAALARSEAQNQQLWNALYLLRDELQAERESRATAVMKMWDDIGFLHEQLTVMGVSNPEEGGGGFGDGSPDPDDPASRIHSIGLKIRANHILQRWIKVKDDAQSRTRGFIMASTWNWLERARCVRKA